MTKRPVKRMSSGAFLVVVPLAFFHLSDSNKLVIAFPDWVKYNKMVGKRAVKSVPLTKIVGARLPTLRDYETTQKADFAIRLKKSKKLMFLEAKAVGVKIDAFKRMKECREKADDWYSHFGKDVVCGAVIAGFIPVSEVHALLNSNLEVFWEHRLDLLYEFIKS